MLRFQSYNRIDVLLKTVFIITGKRKIIDKKLGDHHSTHLKLGRAGEAK
jgi:hypothetical protein